MSVRFLAPAVALALAACAGPPSGNATQADVNAAAAEAQGDIDTYAANTLADRPPVANVPAPAPLKSSPTPAPVETSAEATAAVDVARTYFALLEARNYGRAYRLWEDDGAATGMSARQFADSFKKFASYRAEVGAPGAIEAGAGQRYTAVPVRVTGLLADGGRPFALAGALTLHRTVVDGATAEQQAWRIRDSSLRPRPELAARGDAAPAECGGRTRVSERTDGERGDSRVWTRGDDRDLAGEGRNGAADTRAATAC